MSGAISSSGEEPPPVWPYAHGRVRGQAVEPLHRAAPEAVEEWSDLGEFLRCSTVCGSVTLGSGVWLGISFRRGSAVWPQGEPMSAVRSSRLR